MDIESKINNLYLGKRMINPLFQLYEIIGQSDLTLIGYSHKDERIKDALLSKINPLSIGRVKASFSIKQHLRDIKIDGVLSDKPFLNGKVIHIDLNDVEIDSGEGKSASLGRAKILQSFVEELREQCISFGYKAIMTSALYQTANDTPIHNFMGGSAPMYASDLVIKLSGDLKIIKNRYCGDSKNFDISTDELKKLLYI